MKIVNKLSYSLLFLSLLAISSCSDYLEVEPQDKLTESQNYRDVYDADAAVIGVYGKFMNLAKKYVVLNEVRADLISVTNNADPNLRELQNHEVSPDNPYANPADFYKVILNCNDVLANFDKMLADKRFTQEEYNQRYADIGALRSWIYLQLGIHYGNVPYITDPLKNIEDIKDESKFIRLPFDRLLEELVHFTEALPYVDPYTAESLVINVDGYNTAKFFINKEFLLGDLNLWKGNYTQAATHYRTVMETATGSGNDSERFNTYRLAWGTDIIVSYIRYQEQDLESLINTATEGWGSLFSREMDNDWNYEWIWVLPFSPDFEPENPFINLFSMQGGEYLLKPSQKVIDLWGDQTQLNGFPYDARGRKFSYKTIGGQPVVMKYLSNYLNFETFTPDDFFDKQGQWFLYRAAQLHLRFAEAANRDGRHRLADAFLNNGVHNEYDIPGTVDVTDIQQTHDVPPYDFDARQGDFPYYRGDWYRGTGVRGRAYLEAAEVKGDSTIAIENNIIQEAALELAFEGNRWGDLVRVALRRNDPAFLADKVYEKLQKEGDSRASEVRSKLMNPDNWYLPFNWKEEDND
ncbi:RagB/SusD family nutrient uptake outer membrane protein [Gramella sp. AN32]|uniref:RagB/SusD family nutrient uptake outer membrane protein n=1 Tax=Christiangramia antarctica TaxID=2058158 RepID=A0ABW5X352_9FLAO|nr:RagB/SusD family nutrient uptake outer membrane protein [Gramella sp. AN32]MCM4157235.1 RagB/SusD family protein [Gramella sp. AN32]